MGRLFWKIFAGFWLALLAAAIGVGLSIHFEQRARFERWVSQYEDAALARGPIARQRIEDMALVLREAGTTVAAQLLRDRDRRGERRPVLVVDAQGRDLLERAVPPAALEQARELVREDRAESVAGVVRARAPDGGEYLVFSLPGTGAVPTSRAGMRDRPRPTPASPWTLLGAGILASLAFSAALAWYMARPIRLMRATVQQIAAGRLDARVSPALGSRRDELAELGRDIDTMSARLQALLDSQRRLLHDVSHELRSPLARLQAAVGLAQQTPERAAAMFERVERETLRLDALVGEVLTLARMETGRDLAPAVSIDLMALIEQVVDDARFEASQLGRSVIQRGDSGPIMMLARAELLHRAFDNIVRNALAHTAAGTAVEIEIRRDADRILIRVADRGPGLSPVDIERVFEPFARAGDAASRNGFGLGLAIARRAIEAHAGTVRARVRDGGGLEMWVELSVHADSGTQHDPTP